MVDAATCCTFALVERQLTANCQQLSTPAWQLYGRRSYIMLLHVRTALPRAPVDSNWQQTHWQLQVYMGTC
jgi:hypothetical protein